MHSRRYLPSALLGLAALACCGAAGAKSLYPLGFVDTINSPGAVVLADVNGDGIPDIVEIGTDQTITVMLGNGDGTFRPTNQFYVTGNLPKALAVADVNRDGNPDIVAVNYTDATVAVLLGNGDGTFKAQTADEKAAGNGTAAPTYPVGKGAMSVVLVDLNGDGKPDIVTADYLDNTLSVLLNKGDGTFGARTVVTVGFGPDFVTSADMNKDGKPDILVSDSSDNAFSVLLGNGDGTFKVQAEIRVSVRPAHATLQMLVVGDFDKDGNLDVISTNADTNSDIVVAYPGNGDGSFGKPYGIQTGQQTLFLQTAALTGSGGNLDLIAGSFADSTLRVLFGKGNGGFNSAVTYPASGLTTSLATQPLAVADLDGDGKPDIVLVNATGSFLQVMHNDGSGGFHPANSIVLGSVPSDVQSGDLNGDHHADVAEINAADGTLGVLLGNGNGTFQPLQTYPVGSHPVRLMLADVNGDGILDAITANNGDGTVSVLIGNGDGTFQAARSFAAGPNPVDVAVVDMDQDGKMDLVVANAVVNTVSILYGQGGGSFSAPVSFPAGSTINALAAGDLNRDGFPDVVTVGGNVAVLLNDGKGGLLPVVLNKNNLSQFTYPGTGNRVILKDVNNDGNPDIVISDSSNNELTVLLGNSQGFFNRTPLVSPTCSNPGNLAAADLNGDGNLDVVVSCAGSSVIGVLLGNGQGTFISTPYPAELDPRGVVIADFNEDGNPDIAVINGGSDDMNVLLQIPGIVAADTAPNAISAPFSAPNNINAITGNFEATDADGDPLTYVLIDQPADGIFSYDSTTGDFTYQADPGFVGSDSMSFQVSDGVKLSNIATININVHGSTSSSSKSHKFLGTLPLPLLPLLGWFAALRRRRN